MYMYMFRVVILLPAVGIADLSGPVMNVFV